MTTWTVPAHVVRVRDGDTIVCNLSLGWSSWRMNEPVRLSGVSCPELKEPGGREAAAFVREMLLPVTLDPRLPGVPPMVTVVSEKVDKYRRTLGRVLLPGGQCLNDVLIKVGHGKAV